MSDIYFDAQHNCLKNKLGITNRFELNQVEREYHEIRRKQELPLGNFDYDHLKAIHKHLFQDVYSWVGEERVVNMSKGGSSFCLVKNITPFANKVFNELKQENHLQNILDKDTFVDKFTNYFADVNAAHPFREGNGRTSRTFFSMLAKNAGYNIDYSKINKDKWLLASIASFAFPNDHLKDIFSPCISPGKRISLENKRARGRENNLSR